ncbi:MAG: phosphate acyltransferase PlsX [Planctomycetes bacterium]|nr:phosphate acyltransferase PlsX [Planctomycetota bacterium]
MLDQRIALDVMGGDLAPDATLAGALALCTQDGPRRMDPRRVLLVGDERVIRSRLDALGGASQLGGDGFAIQHASEVVGMSESPAAALRAKPDSSISVCVGAVKRQLAAAVVSMGNTGAVVGACTLGLGTLEGVRRPAIAVTLSLTGRPVTLLDMGANAAAKAQDLVQFAEMGAVYARGALGVEAPRVGLLNIGSEPTKGTDLLKEAHQLLAAQAERLHFVGNVEGNDIFHSAADVVVTDGFTGNVVLKLLEGFSGFMLHLLLKELKAHNVEWTQDALGKVRRQIDYAEYGGALLLGVNGIVVKGHGRSDANAVANALHVAARALDANVNQHIVSGLRAS